MRTGAACNVAEVAGRVLALKRAQPGRTHVVVPSARIKKLRTRGVRIYRAGGRRPVRKHKLVFRFRVQNVGLASEMVQKRVGEESAVIETDRGLPSAFSGVRRKMNLRPIRYTCCSKRRRSTRGSTHPAFHSASAATAEMPSERPGRTPEMDCPARYRAASR